MSGERRKPLVVGNGRRIRSYSPRSAGELTKKEDHFITYINKTKDNKVMVHIKGVKMMDAYISCFRDKEKGIRGDDKAFLNKAIWKAASCSARSGGCGLRACVGGTAMARYRDSREEETRRGLGLWPCGRRRGNAEGPRLRRPTVGLGRKPVNKPFVPVFRPILLESKCAAVVELPPFSLSTVFTTTAPPSPSVCAATPPPGRGDVMSSTGRHRRGEGRASLVSLLPAPAAHVTLRLHLVPPTSPAAVASLSLQAARVSEIPAGSTAARNLSWTLSAAGASLRTVRDHSWQAAGGDDASSVFLIIVLSLVIMASIQVLGSAEGHKTAVPAIFVFGDGMLDVGNNNYLPSDAPQADYPYYGIDFPGSEPTGRFSNGYNMADFIATIPFKYQVKNFNDTVSQMEANLGHQKLSKLLAKSLFLISIGNMDLSVNIWRVLRYSRKPSPFNIPNTLSSYKAIIMQLYGLGARKFGIINIQPLGCQPWVRQNLENNVNCNDSMNSLAREFNDGLKPLFSNLSSQLSGLSYSIADFYAFSNATFMNPRAYGFVNIKSTCCIPPCTPEHEPPCQNRKQYWFWDLSYTTERAAKLAASAFYDGPARFTAPVNFKRLIKMK
uniref:GDSL esterase/lipase n=1 Tax=Oryza glumipatula TaxID=40148 RepID=A0A0D9YQV0_9ORYZ